VTRHSLLLTAVATVTVPGLLAVFGVIGHDQGAGQGDIAAALDSAALSGPFPVAPATARAAVRNNVAAVQRASGAPLTILSRVTASQQASGLQLLDKAADAGLAATYQGTEVTSQSGVNGSVTVVSQVWHEGGDATRVKTSSGAMSATTAATADAANAASSSPDGVFGVTKSLVALLGRHYVAVYRGSGTVAGRAAAVVELYRFDGSLAAQYWLDRQTLVPLRRELFDTSDNVISEDSFVRVQFGAQAAGAAVPSTSAQSTWATVVSPARFLASLTGQGWPVTGTVAGGLPLYAAAWTQTANGKVAELEYSDGLYVVSLFVQQGTLAARLPGWQQVRVAGQQAFVSGQSVSWSGAGLVYTMIADVPPQTARQVVGALPGSGPPGLLGRLERGFGRMARLVNPFS
jgi:sigma-E factor negative regulatory protein RseB